MGRNLSDSWVAASGESESSEGFVWDAELAIDHRRRALRSGMVEQEVCLDVRGGVDGGEGARLGKSRHVSSMWRRSLHCSHVFVFADFTNLLRWDVCSNGVRTPQQSRGISLQTANCQNLPTGDTQTGASRTYGPRRLLGRAHANLNESFKGGPVSEKII